MHCNRFLALVALMMLSCVNCVYSQPVADNIDKYVSAWYKSGRFNGSVLVAEKDHVVYEGGFGSANLEYNIENRADTRFNIGSIAKQFTTVLVFQLVAEGLIKLDGTISDYLPDYRADTGREITIDQLLRQTSGLPCYLRDYRPQAGDDLRLPFPAWTHFQRAQLVKDHLSGDLKFQPGSRYSYSNTNFFLLYLIIEKVSGKSLAQNYQERIFNPLGMKQSGLLDDFRIVENWASGYTKTPLGYLHAKHWYAPNIYGAGSIFSSVEDLFVWNRALRSNKALPKAWQEKMLTPYINEGSFVKHAYSVDFYTMRLPNLTEPVEYSSFDGALPGYGVDAFTFPRTDHTIIVLDNSEQFNQTLIAAGVYRILQGEPIAMPKPLAADVLGETAVKSGVADALDAYRNLKAKHQEEFDFEGVDNTLADQAYLLSDAGRFDAALQVSELLVALRPNSPQPLRALGRIYERSGRPALAQEMLKKAADLAEQERQLYSHLENREFDDAEAMIKKIQRESPCEAILAPSRIGPLYDRAFREKRVDDAIRICNLWMLGNPQDVGPYFSLARIYQQSGRKDEAIQCYEAVLRMSPNGRSASTAKMRLEELKK